MVTFVTDMDSLLALFYYSMWLSVNVGTFLNLLHCFKFKLDIFMRKKIDLFSKLCFNVF